jgi:hypothetical protein
MTSICFHPNGPTRQAAPLALAYASRRLLAEASSGTINVSVLAVRTETLLLRASMMITATLEEIPGCRRAGIND